MRPLLFLLLVLAAALPARSAEPPVILVLGDSLSAGYGLAPGQGWVSLLQQRLKKEGYGHRVVNASVTGETTDGGLARIDRALATHEPGIVILELGGNDGLRGLPPAQIRANLSAMIRDAQAQGARVLLLGVKVPPNYGEEYTRGFEAVFRDLAKTHRTALVPFLLEDFAEKPEFFQPDRIHPTEAAQPFMLDRVWPALKRLLK